MASVERIVLHIGVEKTGTTTLQVALALNRALLKDRGFVFPVGERGSWGHLGLTLFAATTTPIRDIARIAGLAEEGAIATFRATSPPHLAPSLTLPRSPPTSLPPAH